MNRTLGETLSSARRALGASIADAEQETRIRTRSLEALERADYDKLPNPAYVKGYIISYAKFLGLDPAPLLELYREETGTVA
ncbi:MAG: helix-turn-helix domain-containing protein, partial [Coriobacteriia bacterium]|nr:helix-turn-helix domain-containing protein [Coriobacteriia bacterium]